MIVTCQNCRTRFRVRPEALRPQGTKMRCSRCGATFRAMPPGAAKKAGPPPGVSDEDYVLYGGKPPAARLEAAPQEPLPAQSRPQEPSPPPAAPPEPKSAAKVLAPQPEPQQAAPPPQAPEPVQAAPPAPEPAAQAPEAPAPPAPPAPEVSEERRQEAKSAPAGPEPAKAPPPAEGPWPAAAPETEQVAFGPATTPYGAPLPPPRPAARGRLEGLRRSFNQQGPLVRVALAVVAVLVLGLFAYRAGLIGGERADAEGNRRISFTGVSGFFLKNQHDGIVYVVQGLARNGYQDKRGKIRIKAAIYDAAGKPVRQQVIFAGNVFSREELQRLPLKEIAAKLAEPEPQQAARPGSTVPFMAVFGDLPASLGEFSLEAAGSSPSASS